MYEIDRDGTPLKLDPVIILGLAFICFMAALHVVAWRDESAISDGLGLRAGILQLEAVDRP